MKRAIICSLFVLVAGCSKPPSPLTKPQLSNNPSWDVIVTNRYPMLSFFNASGGAAPRTYEIQLDVDPAFGSEGRIEYEGVPEGRPAAPGARGVTLQRHAQPLPPLQDKAQYFWRVRAIDAGGKEGPWAVSRFFVDTEADDAFMNLVRVPVREVHVSSGFNEKNIVDLDDPGQATFWQSTPPGADTQWVRFDLGRTWTVSRVWMLSAIQGKDGWLADFRWQASNDGQSWKDIPDAAVTGNTTFRNIIDFAPVSARYLRLVISKWHGYAAQLNAVTIYSPGTPPVPDAPEGDYVLVVGDQQNGFTFTELAAFVESLPFGLKTLTVPHYEVSLAMLQALDPQPIAVILSGNNASYQNLPMFEYNGVYEIIREGTLPLLGICCGHQQLAMASGYTFANAMGWEDISAMEEPRHRSEIEITKKGDPIFAGMQSPFVGVEVHGWSVVVPPPDYEVIAKSSYLQAMRHEKRLIYGEQFHGEIRVPYNQGTPYLVNFLKLALDQAHRSTAAR